MSVLEGLAAYKQRKEAEEARRAASDRPKIQRFALEKDGDSAIVRFAQEIDFDSKNYDESLGIGFVNIEHTNGADPKNGWKNRANCTIDSQGKCFPCEKVSNRDVEWENRKGWKQKEKFYINVIAGEPREVVEKSGSGERKRYFTTDLADDAKDGRVYLLEQGVYNGIYNDLSNYLLEEKVSKGTITNKFFKITRRGSGFNDTSYSILPIDVLPKSAADLSEFELYNVKEDVLVEVPYNQQEAFYFRGIEVDNAPDSPVVSDASADDIPW